jgi:hypothetical protein
MLSAPRRMLTTVATRADRRATSAPRTASPANTSERSASSDKADTRGTVSGPKSRTSGGRFSGSANKPSPSPT